jgi:hypothetical protein
MWNINAATAAWPRFMRYAIIQASVLTAIVAVCAYIALYEPLLGGCGGIILAGLYFTAPFCWLMPLALRSAHLALWLALVLAGWTVGLFTLWGDGLILDVPATIAGRILHAVLDLLFFLNGVLAVRARSTDRQPLVGPHAPSIIAASTLGTAIALHLWSAQISHEIADQVRSLSHNEPYCLAVNGRVIESFADASGLRLVRNRNFIGPGAGFSFPTMSQHYAVLAVQDDKTARYWNWSFRGRRFMPLSSPMQGLGSYACNPLTKESIVDDYLYRPGLYVPWPTVP